MVNKTCKSDGSERLDERLSCFFENKDCCYYLRYTGLERINCLFSIYTFDDCDGTYEMLNGIKDCSKCLLPHKAENYSEILQELVDVNQQKMEQFSSATITQQSTTSD